MFKKYTITSSTFYVLGTFGSLTIINLNYINIYYIDEC